MIALRKIEKFNPDVITLDLELPRMDGLTFLKKLMHESPMPLVVISSMTDNGSCNAIRALEFSAIEVITKPDMSSPEKLMDVSHDIQQAIKAAFRVNVGRIVPSLNILE